MLRIKHLKIPSNKLKPKKAARLQGKLLEPVTPLMSQVSGLYCNKLLDVAIVTGLDMGPAYKKEKRAVRLSTRPVAAVKGKDIFELFASQSLNHQEEAHPMKHK